MATLDPESTCANKYANVHLDPLGYIYTRANAYAVTDRHSHICAKLHSDSNC
jgi:hypothetical protein